MKPYTIWFLLFVLLSMPSAFTAPLTQPSSDTLHCSVDGKAVHLSWQIAFFAPIKGWIVERDGEALAKLAPESSEFFDGDAPAGEHHYRLSAINFDGSVNAIGECLAAVGNFGMHCSVEGRVAYLEWGPILIDVHIERFDVYRNGLLIESLPTEVTAWKDNLPAASGIFRYNVRAVTSPGQDFLLGACTVRTPGNALLCHVSPPVVELDWSGVPLPEFVIAFFVVVRDDIILGATNALHFEDVPGPGIHAYQVFAVSGALARDDLALTDLLNAYQIGECRVAVPGPPDDLLFFSNSFLHDNTLYPAILPPEGNGRITCLASHRDGLQGWSFGVCSDPSVLVLDDVTLEGTKAGALNGGAGPSFLSIDRFAEGLTMAAIVDEADPTSTLPPSASDSLLQVQYSPGPDAVPFGRYPVRYCETLGGPPVAVLYVVGGFELRPATLQGTVVLPGPLPPFLLRGDVNGDEVVAMSDAVALLNWLFLGGKTPGCAEQADINGNGEISLADAVYELQGEFAGGAPPPSPFPECGPDPAALGCEEPSCPQPVF